LLRALAGSADQGEPPLSASTLYRFLHQRGRTTRDLLTPPGRKKFEAERSNQIWQADMLVGPWVQRPGGGRQQVFLHAMLDDASRLIPHAQFYTSQGLEAVLDCFRQAVAARAVPVRVYIDNAKVYRSPQLARITASLGTLITHSRPYQPEGRGKIERFFRTLREQCLATLDRNQPLTLDALNELLGQWIDQYHRTEHSAIGTTPLLRWQRDIDQVRPLPPGTDLRRLFFQRVDRLVRRDSTFLVQHRLYEAPAALAGHTIEVRLDPFDPTQVEVWHQGACQGTARLVDPVINGRMPSASPAAPAATPSVEGRPGATPDQE
jgi:transposase InsO family protein